MEAATRRRLSFLIASLLVIPIGYGFRVAQILPEWCRNFLGNVAYCLLWSLLVAIISPRMSALWLAIAGASLVGLIEFSQLIQFHWLIELRSCRLGQLALGSGFSWLDQVEYCGAALINALLLRNMFPADDYDQRREI